MASKDRARIHLVEEKPASKQALPDLSDDDLMVLAKAGRQDAFETLIHRHQTFVLALAVRYLGDRTTGRDVAQDVFLALWADRERYRPRGRFKSYLVSVTINRCHTVARQNRSQEKRVSELAQQPTPKGAEEPLTSLVEQERAREVQKMLTEVPEKHRTVLILRFTQELSLEEIAKTTGAPLGTVKSHLFRGLKRLRSLTKESLS